MTEGTVIHLGREALVTVLLVAGPMIGFSLAVGLLVSILQAATQIQEQTLSFIPKIVAVFVAGLIFGPWMLRVLIDFAMNLFANINQLVG
ncbi:MAG: flagellar biosynthesis protein FliQ [Firmicutes bacterium]|nr:flagellar biosynthesis protein FliQ [Bacillota bacterium]